MAPVTTPAHLPPLGEHVREEVGHELQATLTELIDLALFGKQLHWCVSGPHFRSLHLQLDELVAEWQEHGDTIAERAVAIGYFPDGQAGAVAAGAAPAIARGAIEDHAVVRELSTRLATVCERVRERMDRLGELDAATQDAIIEVLRGLEENLWMIRAQAPGGGNHRHE